MESAVEAFAGVPPSTGASTVSAAEEMLCFPVLGNSSVAVSTPSLPRETDEASVLLILTTVFAVNS